jgi:tetratricopeptide (TPR) repeat protein
MALFEARASSTDPRFRLDDSNVAAVADICRQVDGVPLAIELAAARVQVLGLEGLRAGLLQSFRALGPGDTRHSPRHRTLRATFDWTHALLPTVERKLLRRLAVFIGGFTLKLAQQVATDTQEAAAVIAPVYTLDEWGVVDGIDALIDKSLVVADGADPPRYRLLEVTRAYALEKLGETAESQALCDRQARAIWQLFAEAEVAKNEQIRGALTMSDFLQLLAPELDNLRAARSWSQGPSGNRTLAIGLVASSSEALRMLGLSTEAMQAMQPLREKIDEHVAPEMAELFWTGLCALGTHGRLPSSEMLALIEEAERLYRRIGNRRRIHLGLYRKGFALMHLGRCEEGQLVTREMESLEAPDWPAKAVAQRLNLQAGLDGMMGRFDASIEAFTRAAGLLRFERGEDDFVLNTLANLCLSVLCTQRHDEALAVARDVLRRRPSPVVRNSANRALLTALTFLGRLDEASTLSHQAMRDWRSDDLLPYMLSVFAWLAHQQGRIADAVRLDGAAQMQVVRKALPESPVSDRARTLLFDELERCGCTDEELARWRFEGEQAKDDAMVAWCLGDRITSATDGMVPSAPP